MKKLLLSILFVGVATFANAQKSEVAEAKRLWGIFQFSMMQDPNAPKTPMQRPKGGPPGPVDEKLATGKASSKVGRTDAPSGGGNRPVKTTEPSTTTSFVEKQIASLNEGMAHADKAILNEKTKDSAEPYVYKALFASTIALVDTVNLENSMNAQKMAETAIAKAKSLDTKGDEKENINAASINLRNAISGRGLRAYNAKDYNNAYNYFSQLIALNPQDTSMYMNAGLVAKLSGKYPESIQNFKKMIEFNVPDAKNYYSEIISISMENQKDTTAALGYLKEALTKYPDDPEFVGVETDIYVARGDIQKSQESLKRLIAKDPNKAIYQYLMGDTFYKQALNLQKDRAKLDSKKVKEFDAITAKMLSYIDQSIPYYKKSLELDPKFAVALETLSQIYAFKGEKANYDEMKKRLEAIPVKN